MKTCSRPRILFAGLLALLSAPGRFASVFYQAHSQTTSHIGILLSVALATSLFLTPLICRYADATNRIRTARNITILAVIVFQFQILSFPSLNVLTSDLAFWSLLLLRGIYGALMFSLYPLVMAICVASLRPVHGASAGQYVGLERVWGAYTWAIASLILGFAIDKAGFIIIYPATVCFAVIFITLLHIFETSQNQKIETYVPINTPESSQYPTSPTSLSPPSCIWSHLLLGNGINSLLFFNLLFWQAVGMSLVERLLFLVLQDEMQASNLVCGLSITITVLFEIPIFATAPALLSRHGINALIYAGATAFIIRVFAYSLAKHWWVILLLEPLHGATYACFHVASVAYMAERAGHAVEAEAQSVLSVVQGVARIAGVLVGGFVMQVYGSKVMYRAIAVIVFVSMMAFVGVQMCTNSNIGQQKMEEKGNMVGEG